MNDERTLVREAVLDALRSGAQHFRQIVLHVGQRHKVRDAYRSVDRALQYHRRAGRLRWDTKAGWSIK